MKFNGNLEAVARSATEIGKERFVAMLKRRVMEHGHETFFHIRSTVDSTEVVSLFDHVYYYKLEAVVGEFNHCFDSSNTFEAFDQYELDDITGATGSESSYWEYHPSVSRAIRRPLFSTVMSIARAEEPPAHWDELCLENTT